VRRWLVLGLLAAAACAGPEPEPPAAAQSPDAADTAVAPPPAERTAAPGAGPALAWRPGLLGPGTRLADRSPNVLHGDFNGDGVPDLLAVVVVRNARLDDRVRVVQPWPVYEGAATTESVEEGAEVALAVVHGDPAGAADAMFLLHDPNPISILDTHAGRQLEVIGRDELADHYRLADRARGDLIVVPTEAGIDTYVYWDGTTYRTFAPVEIP
jgi:hypothetical protein